MESTALATDRYELTMVQAALDSGVANRRSTFEVFTRRVPADRRFGVVAGIDRVIDAVTAFRFTPEHVAALQSGPTPMQLTSAMRDWLLGYRFIGDISGYAEGELFAPFSPILTVSGTFAEAVVLETVILSILNHDCAIAAGATVIAQAAAGRTLIEMGSRRTDPSAAVAAARAAIIAGFSATSNLEAGARYGVATAGTAAHSFTLAHPDEATAFRAQVASLGIATTLLVDTFDIEQGIRTAVSVANEIGAPGPGAIRIDSGDLSLEAKRARALLDDLGARSTRIVLSGDLDRHTISELIAEQAPVDAFGVGTSVVTGDGHPTAALSYKLVQIDDADGVAHSVAKRSSGKVSLGGAKRAVRVIEANRPAHPSDGSHGDEGRGVEVLDVMVPMTAPVPDGRALQVDLITAGEVVRRSSVADAARRLQESLAELGERTLSSRVFQEDDHAR